MADDAITQSNIGVLGSPFYICGKYCLSIQCRKTHVMGDSIAASQTSSFPYCIKQIAIILHKS